MHKLKMEALKPEADAKDWQTPLGSLNIEYESNKWTFKGVIGLHYSPSMSVTGVCGQSSMSNINAWTKQGKAIPAKDVKIDVNAQAWSTVSTPHEFFQDLNRTKSFTKIQNELLKICAENIASSKISTTIVFGGRVNVHYRTYANAWGVHSGSLARWIAKNKFGTITASHLHQNVRHRTDDDFSIQQVFIWSPLSIDVPPVNRRYCGVFHREDHSNQSLPRMLEVIEKTAKSVLLRPRYFLKNQLAPDDAEVT